MTQNWKLLLQKFSLFGKGKNQMNLSVGFVKNKNNLFNLFSYLFVYSLYAHNSIIISGISNGNGKLSPRLDSGISTPQKNWKTEKKNFHVTEIFLGPDNVQVIFKHYSIDWHMIRATTMSKISVNNETFFLHHM